ncbi:PREDICTED: hydroxyacyl-thioester dehydratase type 2, mitochondrial [Fragaria vesca subsp. vesca]|uniref:hydroxyacyl-thioester dehydratase type 2, mitochondrial n=1 Tax=Fragaria vesca subsp. vesca TaxID=101020 RepID=UPI0002C3166B|nr:PREDICTED: hydroxyacyl-thioester dehydratase type 2, mitochondrial [Fragaria vesca subsp. vesca]XP_011457331.1 PREDICTED: hydroxyacyl-thioester dehydratase type 2, mitochondrial [Fragaria vesca subsp. vesca]
MAMLTRSLVSASIPFLRGFSSAATSFLKTGDVLKRARIFTSEEVLDYSKVSHDSNPLHFDSESAQNAGFEDRVVHGMLVAGLFPKIISSHFPGAVYVSQSLHFRSPVYIGEEIVGEVRAINIREKKNRYLAKFKTACFKNGSVVIDGEAMAILPTLAMEEENTL